MIGYYAHHHGAGHVWRADTIARYLEEPVTLLSTATPPPTHHFADHVRLDSDAGDVKEHADPTASQALHWAPLHHRGLQRRMLQMAAWVERSRPAVVVVDVSVEVANLVRLLGVPVITVAMPGRRDDPAHQWGYRLSTRILAPWTREVYDPAWLHPVADRTHFVGAFSRFDHPSARPPRVPFRRGAVLCGAGGGSLRRSHVATLEAHHPEIRWDVMGGPATWRDDVWDLLVGSDVVVSHAGQNAIAEIATAGRPAVLVAEARPYDEQQEACTALERAGIARWSRDWDGVNAELAKPAVDPHHWARWAPPGAGAAAARIVHEVAEQARPDV